MHDDTEWAARAGTFVGYHGARLVWAFAVGVAAGLIFWLFGAPDLIVGGVVGGVAEKTWRDMPA